MAHCAMQGKRAQWDSGKSSCQKKMNELMPIKDITYFKIKIKKNVKD